MLNDQQESILCDQKKIKGRWKQNPGNLYRRDKRMTDTLKEESSEEEPEILESEVKTALKVWGRNKSPGADGTPREVLQATETKSVKILTRISSTNMETKRWTTDWMRSTCIQCSRQEMPRCSQYGAVVLISHASEVDVQAGFSL